LNLQKSNAELLRQALDRKEAELRVFVADRPIFLVGRRAVPISSLMRSTARLLPSKIRTSAPLAAQAKPLFLAGRKGHVRSWHNATVRCDASIRSLVQAYRTWMDVPPRSTRSRLTQMYGPAVRCKKTSSGWRMCGLASMYPAFDWSLLRSGPSWISARVRSH